MLVISPHLDDAVLSLAGMIQDAVARNLPVTVVTCCAGDPVTDAPASWWDVGSGFTTAGEAAACRREEDRRACALLGCAWCHLDLPDGPYRTGDWEAHLVDALAGLVTSHGEVYVPAGLADNRDHPLARRAALRACASASDRPAVRLYAELPYAAVAAGRELQPDDVPAWWWAGAADALPWRRLDRGIRRLTPDEWRLKRRATFAYASQLAPLGTRFGGFLARPGPMSAEVTCLLGRDG